MFAILSLALTVNAQALVGTYNRDIRPTVVEVRGGPSDSWRRCSPDTGACEPETYVNTHSAIYQSRGSYAQTAIVGGLLIHEWQHGQPDGTEVAAHRAEAAFLRWALRRAPAGVDTWELRAIEARIQQIGGR